MSQVHFHFADIEGDTGGPDYALSHLILRNAFDMIQQCHEPQEQIAAAVLELTSLRARSSSDRGAAGDPRVSVGSQHRISLCHQMFDGLPATSRTLSFEMKDQLVCPMGVSLLPLSDLFPTHNKAGNSTNATTSTPTQQPEGGGAGVSLLSYHVFSHFYSELLDALQANVMYSACASRFGILRSRYRLHRALNAEVEDHGNLILGGGDVATATKVDIRRIGTSVCAKDLVDFIHRKEHTQQGDVVRRFGVIQPEDLVVTTSNPHSPPLEKDTSLSSSAAGHPNSQLTLADAFEEYYGRNRPDAERLVTAEGLSIRPNYSQIADRRLDVFDRYDPMRPRGEHALRLLKHFLKFQWGDDGRYLAELIIPILTAASTLRKNELIELEVTVTGMRAGEVPFIADWFERFGLYRFQPNIRVTLRFVLSEFQPEKYPETKTFEDALRHVFEPLWHGVLAPEAHPSIAKFFDILNGISVAVDDAGDHQTLPSPVNLFSQKWPKDFGPNVSRNPNSSIAPSVLPPDVLFFYFVWSNTQLLNAAILHRAAQQQQSTSSPSAAGAVPPYAHATSSAGAGRSGELPRYDRALHFRIISDNKLRSFAHSTAGLLLADTIVNPMRVATWAPLGYLYYLTRRHVVLTPSMLNAMNLPFNHPDHALVPLLEAGVPVSLSTMDPLHYHTSSNPLHEEYHTAMKVLHLAPVDVTEMCLCSTLQSNFTWEELAEWYPSSLRPPAASSGSTAAMMSGDGRRTEPMQRSRIPSLVGIPSLTARLPETQVPAARLAFREAVLRKEHAMLFGTDKAVSTALLAAASSSREGGNVGPDIQAVRERYIVYPRIVISRQGVSPYHSQPSKVAKMLIQMWQLRSQYRRLLPPPPSAAISSTGGTVLTAAGPASLQREWLEFDQESVLVEYAVKATRRAPAMVVAVRSTSRSSSASAPPHLSALLQMTANSAATTTTARNVTTFATTPTPLVPSVNYNNNNQAIPTTTTSATAFTKKYVAVVSTDGVFDILVRPEAFAHENKQKPSPPHKRNAAPRTTAQGGCAVQLDEAPQPRRFSTERLPSWPAYLADYRSVQLVSSDPVTQVFAKRRLATLEQKFRLHCRLVDTDHRAGVTPSATTATTSVPRASAPPHADNGALPPTLADAAEHKVPTPVMPTAPVSVEDTSDLHRCVKVDVHCHMASGVTARHLLSFIQHKYTHCGNDIVEMDPVTGHPVTLTSKLSEITKARFGRTISMSKLSVALLGVQATRSTFNRFDLFNNNYNPLGVVDLRTLFLKTDNFMNGRYFAELIHEVFRRAAQQMSFAPHPQADHWLSSPSSAALRHSAGDETFTLSSGGSFSEFRLSIYGKSRDEWAKLASWWAVHGMTSPVNTWMIQIPRIFHPTITPTLEDMLANIFLPLWEVSIEPMANPILHHFLRSISGFDAVDNEAAAETDARTLASTPPQSWRETRKPPPFSYWMYHLWANLTTLNRFRHARDLSTFSFRPHCGESGDPDHMIDAFLLADGVNHGIQLKRRSALQYLFYLTQIGLGITPLSNNALFCRYRDNPFPSLFARGLHVALATDGPLQFHRTEEPLLEEYDTAMKHWDLTVCDACEIATNSVRMSGFPDATKRQWLGPLYELRSPVGNDPERSRVPFTRVAFRYETYHNEVRYLEQRAASAIGEELKAMRSPSHEELVTLDVLGLSRAQVVERRMAGLPLTDSVGKTAVPTARETAESTNFRIAHL